MTVRTARHHTILHPGDRARRARGVRLPAQLGRRLWLVPVLLVTLPGCADAQTAPPGPAELRELWEGGRTFAAFLDAADARRETWQGNFDRARVPQDLLQRAEALEGPWQLLVVAEDWCGDSAHTVPYVAKLAESLPGLDLRIVDAQVGRAVMEAHRTPDDRAATPTMVLLDADFADRGCFVERPPELQEWFLENPDGLGRQELVDEKYERYEADAGASTLEEIVSVLEAAARGDLRCGPSGSGPQAPRVPTARTTPGATPPKGG